MKFLMMISLICEDRAKLSPETTEKSRRKKIRRKKGKKPPKKVSGKKKAQLKPNQHLIENDPEKNQILRSKPTHLFSEQENKILDIGKQAYYKALAHYYYPSLPDPEFVFDYTKKIGFFIDLDTYRITLNLANTPNIYLDQEYEDYFFSLSLHEISHYIYCPYDNLTNLRLLAAAIQGGINKYFSPMVVNIFADLIIDQKNHSEFPDLMNWELEKTTEHLFAESSDEKCSDLTKILIRCYEILWKIDIFRDSERDAVTDKISQNVCQIITKNFDDEQLWEKKVKAIAKQLTEILKKSVHLNEEFQQGGGKKNQSPFLIPQDVQDVFGDLTELKNPNLIKDREKNDSDPFEERTDDELQEAIEVLATELDLKTLRDLLSLHGLTDSSQNLALWYRGQAKDLIRVEHFQKKKSGSIPLYPETWRIGDPIGNLDAIQTLLVSPVIIPNMTTRKWKYHEGIGQEPSPKVQDLMIVLDSSGSMDWNFNKKSVTGRYHISLLAAFSAIHYCIRKGSFISAINFSERVVAQPWTNDLRKIEQILLSYQGYGTRLPTRKIEEFAQKTENPALILVISDLEIENWNPAKNTIQKLLGMGHTVISFFIEGDPSILLTKDFQELILQGANFYCIEDIDDLIGLVLSEVKEIVQ